MTRQLYDRFRSFGWQEVETSQAKVGALIVWPGTAGVIIKDLSDTEDRARDRLKGLTVLYPSQLRGGQLTAIDATTLQASLGKTAAPRFIIPTSKKTLFWNTWVESTTGYFVANHILAVDRNHSYSFMLDLSRFNYAQLDRSGPGRPDQATQRYIDEIAAKYGDLRFIVTPVGRGLRISEPSTVYERAVNLTVSIKS